MLARGSVKPEGKNAPAMSIDEMQSAIHAKTLEIQQRLDQHKLSLSSRAGAADSGSMYCQCKDPVPAPTSMYCQCKDPVPVSSSMYCQCKDPIPVSSGFCTCSDPVPVLTGPHMRTPQGTPDGTPVKAKAKNNRVAAHHTQEDTQHHAKTKHNHREHKKNGHTHGYTQPRRLDFGSAAATPKTTKSAFGSSSSGRYLFPDDDNEF